MCLHPQSEWGILSLTGQYRNTRYRSQTALQAFSDGPDDSSVVAATHRIIHVSVNMAASDL